jgi:Asp-tRNA(Asn)/Glu-tRNA(Gln) amidotransferase A subunit family amidase
MENVSGLVDAKPVKNLRNAGAIPIGFTNDLEFWMT